MLPKTIVCPSLLLVEGKDDIGFFRCMTDSMQIEKDVLQIEAYEGKDSLPRFVKLLRNVEGFRDKLRVLGIVRDADQDPRGAFQSVRDVLGRNGINIPAHPEQYEGDEPRVGILILPAADSPGMLEDLCLSSVKTDPAFPCVEQYFDCLRSAGVVFAGCSKNKLHAFLASRKKPGLKLGEAASDFLQTESPVFTHVRHFLGNLRCL